MAHVAAFAGKALEQFEESLVGLCFMGNFVEPGDAVLWQEQPVPVAQHDAGRDRTVVIFLEYQLAQVAVRRLARVWADGAQVEPGAHGVMPLGRSAQSAFGIDAGKAWMTDKGNGAVGG